MESMDGKLNELLNLFEKDYVALREQGMFPYVYSHFLILTHMRLPTLNGRGQTTSDDSVAFWFDC